MHRGTISGMLFVVLGAVLAPACGSDVDETHGEGGGGASTSCPAAVCIERLEQGVAALIATTDEARASTAQACAGIASALGATGLPDVSDPASVTDTVLELVCDAATLTLAGVGTPYSVVTSDLHCRVDADSQLACELEETAAQCGDGPWEPRCPGGAWWESCVGQCGGTCTSDANSSVVCEGTCNGHCVGQCDGLCSNESGGQCDGICTGDCAGACEGSCSTSAGALVDCQGICADSCPGTATGGGCSSNLTPCDVHEGCVDACALLGPFGATCLEPFVLVAPSTASTALTLEEHLPALLAVQEQAVLVVEGMGTFADLVTAVALDDLEAGCLGRITDLALAADPAIATWEKIISVTVGVTAQLP